MALLTLIRRAHDLAADPNSTHRQLAEALEALACEAEVARLAKRDASDLATKIRAAQLTRLTVPALQRLKRAAQGLDDRCCREENARRPHAPRVASCQECLQPTDDHAETCSQHPGNAEPPFPYANGEPSVPFGRTP